LEGDVLKIAYSINCLPGTREHELEWAKEMRERRPKCFGLDPDDPKDSTVVLFLRRIKP
jgi:hypothetical protein